VKVSRVQEDATGRTYGLLADVVECVGCCVDNLALNLVGPTSVVPQTSSSSCYINILGHAEGLAVVEGLDSGEKVGILEEQVGKLDKKLAAVLGCLLPPGPVEGLAGRLDGNVNILLAGLLDLCDNLFCGRVDNVESLAINRLDELVVDEAVPRVSRRNKQWCSRTASFGSWWSQLTDQWAGRTRPSGES
jgi:hypothetical protein